MDRAELEVLVVWSPGPRQVEQRLLRLPAGATLGDALRVAGIEGPAGVWGRVRDASTTLRDGDRVEIYRALTVDPKQARRLRYKGQRRAPKEKRPA
jgi:putative ubiquitin-RnfH superfamily antitoxin RatB of RatAB toxin-antitoxin module